MPSLASFSITETSNSKHFLLGFSPELFHRWKKCREKSEGKRFKLRTWKGINKLSIDEEFGELDGRNIERRSLVAIRESSHVCVCRSKEKIITSQCFYASNLRGKNRKVPLLYTPQGFMTIIGCEKAFQLIINNII